MCWKDLLLQVNISTSLNSPFDLIYISVDSHQDITMPVITKFTHETLQNQVT